MKSTLTGSFIFERDSRVVGLPRAFFDPLTGDRIPVGGRVIMQMDDVKEYVRDIDLVIRSFRETHDGIALVAVVVPAKTHGVALLALIEWERGQNDRDMRAEGDEVRAEANRARRELLQSRNAKKHRPQSATVIDGVIVYHNVPILFGKTTRLLPLVSEPTEFWIEDDLRDALKEP